MNVHDAQKSSNINQQTAQSYFGNSFERLSESIVRVVAVRHPASPRLSVVKGKTEVLDKMLENRF